MNEVVIGTNDTARAFYKLVLEYAKAQAEAKPETAVETAEEVISNETAE